MAAEGRAMMGSKADMIGSKFDEVSSDALTPCERGERPDQPRLGDMSTCAGVIH